MQNGKFLTACAAAKKYEELDAVLIEGSARLFAEYKDEFRTAFIALLQAAEEKKATLLAEAEVAVQKLRQARKKTRPRMWGDAAAQKEKMEEDPCLQQGLTNELAAIKDGYQAELSAMLRELKITLDERASKFASLHLECMSNARAIVEYHTGFTMSDSSPKSEAGTTSQINVV